MSEQDPETPSRIIQLAKLIFDHTIFPIAFGLILNIINLLREWWERERPTPDEPNNDGSDGDAESPVHLNDVLNLIGENFQPTVRLLLVARNLAESEGLGRPEGPPPPPYSPPEANNTNDAPPHEVRDNAGGQPARESSADPGAALLEALRTEGRRGRAIPRRRGRGRRVRRS
ncbi:hypothetical protein F4803DRAFT_573159 [Xylaria telfairii]|nr:hypothetical protein F4803DRAFT_573159 [Xylaria telfairii]